jgi:hypothetical protein
MKQKQHLRHHVKHDYHDHLQCECNVEVSHKYGNKQSRACNSTVKFPLKLHELLDNAELEGIADIISWQIHGRAFSIHNKKDFCLRVMPQWFMQTKITSFFRQLSLYGFLRITQGRDKGAYYHECFLRGKHSLAKRMLRQKVKGTKIKGLPSPETEPNFYCMPYVPELPKYGPGLCGTQRNKVSTILPASSLAMKQDNVELLLESELITNEKNSKQKKCKKNMNLNGDIDDDSWHSDFSNFMVFDSLVNGDNDDCSWQSDFSNFMVYDSLVNGDNNDTSWHNEVSNFMELDSGEEDSLMSSLINSPDHLSLQGYHFDDVIAHGTSDPKYSNICKSFVTETTSSSSLQNDHLEDLSCEDARPIAVVSFSSHECQILLALFNDDTE